MKIGFFSSSTPITALSPQRFARAQDFLRSKQIELVAGSLTGKQDHYRSGSIQKRAAEINQLIHDPEVSVIMSTIGGTNTNAVLPYIDYEYLRSHPKTFVGYSDTTALLLAIYTQAPNCRVLYGPALVAAFGEFPPFVEQTWNYFQTMIDASIDTKIALTAPKFWTDERANWESFEHFKTTHENHWGYTTQPILSGKVVGGNLDTMYGFMGAKYFPKFSSDDLLFIEDAEKDAATVEKNFAMLKNAGVFDQVKGIILGKHALFDDRGTGRRPIDILLEVLNGADVPIIYDYDSCHTTPMMTTPIGARATFDAKKMTVEFEL
ncbi:S66 peptidase family protein [Lapidilactobacillus mulanensis]|uniref:S66 peptidase family protein n=1 Tax=Lapidilactobacillus mulanensis TaxID=2485999 RepID=A0ABW4DRL7_9LACO|nr:S66 peptidase family protein [Lapidilactobacillus mulanensis]